MHTDPRPSTTLLLHGTWAQNQKWWRWGYGFAKAVHQRTGNVYRKSDVFRYDLRLRVTSIKAGGEQLLQWCSHHNLGKLTVIAHSHGGNLAIHALTLGLQVESHILLGTPIRDDFIPPKNRAKHIFNIYHQSDDIQWLGASSNPRGNGRLLPEADRNIEVSKYCVGSDFHWELHTADLWYAADLWSLL